MLATMVEEAFTELVANIGGDERVAAVFSLLLMISPESGEGGGGLGRLREDIKHFLYR